NIHGVRHPIEGSIEQVKIFDAAQIGGPRAMEAQMIDVLVPTQKFEELDCSRRPIGNVRGEQLEQGERSLSSAIPDRVRDVAARDQEAVELASLTRRRVRGLSRFEHRLVAYQVGYVGHRPFLGSFDEPVFIELRYVVFDYVDLLGDHSE